MEMPGKKKAYTQVSDEHDEDDGADEEAPVVTSPGFVEVELTNGSPPSNGAELSSPGIGGGEGEGGSLENKRHRWARWAAGASEKVQRTVGAVISKASQPLPGTGMPGDRGHPRAPSQTPAMEDVPEHWGLTAREMGRIERRWALWSTAVSTARPSADVDERVPWDRLSLAPAALGALQARGIFYGWAVAVVAALALVLEAPVGELAIAVMLNPVGASLQCDEADLARALALAHVFSGLLAPLGPYALTRLAPGAAAAACALVLALGMLVASSATSLASLGVGVTLAKLAGQGVLVPLVMSALHGWWRSRRRVVDTAVCVCLALGTLGVAPLLVRAAATRAPDAWRGTLVGGALFAALVGAPVLALLLPRAPNAYGQMPDGAAVSAAFQGDEALEIADLPTQVWSFADAACSFKFWLAQLALVTVRVHAAGLLFMHGSAAGAPLFARAWGALAGAMISVCVLTPGPLWCQLFGSVDAHRIELLSACSTLAASGIAIGVWAQWYDTFKSVGHALRLGAMIAVVFAVGVGVGLHDEVDGSVQSWQALKAARDMRNLAGCFGRRGGGWQRNRSI
ncbi:hypothetical protein T492DRAFT_960926 [Pavlovales sp. CCMP2436]|nr:hypothetical protein T492DRAFT_960926 [Pavlovales sp. CCMP2436]